MIPLAVYKLGECNETDYMIKTRMEDILARVAFTFRIQYFVYENRFIKGAKYPVIYKFKYKNGYYLALADDYLNVSTHDLEGKDYSNSAVKVTFPIDVFKRIKNKEKIDTTGKVKYRKNIGDFDMHELFEIGEMTTTLKNMRSSYNHE